MRLPALLIVVALMGCQTKPPVVLDPAVAFRDVPTAVQVKCLDKRDPAPVYPDTDEALAQISVDDLPQLAVIYRAGRELRMKRLEADDQQIKACAGD